MDMNSIAQHAVPKGNGQSELPRAQPTIASSFVVRYVPPARSVISRADSPGSVMRPFSGSSPGAMPCLRPMIESGFSNLCEGIHRGAILLEKTFTSHARIVGHDESSDDNHRLRIRRISSGETARN